MENELLQRIQPLLAPIAANAGLAEEQRRVPDDNVRMLKEAGFFRALQPKAFGGSELDFPEYVECVVRLAEACPSTAWAAGLLANHAHAIALYAPEVQREVWADDTNALVCSSVAPLGTWEPVEGGIRLSGRFGWSSGCDHANWAVLGYMGKNNVGQPGPCFALVPKQDYTIIDDWDTAALRGTGSKTIQVDCAFVPDRRSESLFALNYGLSRGFRSQPGPIFNMPFSPVFSLGFSAVAVGIARRFQTVFIENTKARKRAYTGGKSAEDAASHMRLAESANQTMAALELLRRDWREMSDRARSGKLPALDDVMHWRCHQAYAAKSAIEAVQRMMAVCGGKAWFNNNELQKLFRDVHITGVHAQTDYGMASQTFGRYLLGLPMDGKFY